jgi:hypothetical protein
MDAMTTMPFHIVLSLAVLSSKVSAACDARVATD